MITVEISNHQKAFHNAHNDVIEHLGGAKIIIKTNHFLTLKKGWKELHNVNVPGTIASWKYLEFASEEEYLLWLIKYSR